MVELSTATLVIISLCVVTALIGILNSLANEVLHERSLHDLKHEVIALRCQYLRRLIELYDIPEIDESIEVEVVEDEIPESDESDSSSAESLAA